MYAQLIITAQLEAVPIMDALQQQIAHLVQVRMQNAHLATIAMVGI